MAEITTSEVPPSKVREEIIREAKRLEERTLDSMKGHHCAASGWNRRGLQLGLPTLVTSIVVSGAVFVEASKDIWLLGITAAVLSTIVSILTGITTFLNPNEKENAHLSAAHAFDRLNNDARMFWSIECWQSTEEVLTSRLNDLVERKNKLNSDSPSIPNWAYREAQEGIKRGEADYLVDKQDKADTLASKAPPQIAAPRENSSDKPA